MAAWTPTTDAALAAKVAAWLDFSDASTMLTSGGAVTQITDKAHGRVFVASGTPPPLDTLNGLTAVSLLGVNPLIVVDTMTYTGGGAFVGVSYGDDEAEDFKDYMAVLHESRSFYMNPRMARIWGYGNCSWNTLGAPAQANVFSIDVPLDGPMNTSLVHQDGILHAQSGTATNATRNFSDLKNAPVDLRLGGSTPSSANPLMAECFWVAGNLTTDERQMLEGYLAHKWGTAANLPAEHPYKSAAPQSSAGPILAAAAGALSVGGQAALLLRAGRLSAGSGSLAASGQPALLKRGVRLAGDACALSAAGQPAALTVSRRLQAEAGVISAAGQPAALSITSDRRLTADAGAVVVAGAAAGLRASRRLAAQGGSVAAAGQLADLRAFRRVAAAAGALTTAGGAADLVPERRLVADYGGIAALGQPAGLIRTEVIPATAVMPGVWRERSAAGTWQEHELRGTWRRA